MIPKIIANIILKNGNNNTNDLDEIYYRWNMIPNNNWKIENGEKTTNQD